MVGAKKLILPSHILTVAIVGLSSIVYCFPRLSSMLVYNRTAILDGELWRLITAPVVHFSASHFFWDIAAFGVTGFAIGFAGYRNFWRVCCIAGLTPGFIFILTQPDLAYYGGLSGLATGALAYFCLCRAFITRRNRMIWLLLLLVMGLKMIIEAATGDALFAQSDATPFRVLPLAHLIGYCGAVATLLWSWPCRHHKRGVGELVHWDPRSYF